MKRLAIILTMALLLCAVPMTAFAEQSTEMYSTGDVAVPYYKLTIEATSRLYYDGETATCVSSVSGFSSVTSVTIEQYLQKEGFLWIYFTYDDNSEWKTTVNKSGTRFTNVKSEPLTSGNYRLKSIITLKTASGQSETITVYSEVLTV